MFFSMLCKIATRPAENNKFNTTASQNIINNEIHLNPLRPPIQRELQKLKLQERERSRLKPKEGRGREG